MTATETLLHSAMTVLRGVEGLGSVHDGIPLQAVHPHAVVEAGPETDWSHKSGEGRELRLAVTIRDQGERPTRLRRLMGEAEDALAGLATEGSWRLVTFQFLRSRTMRDAGRANGVPAWAGVVEFRARMLAGA